jgi:hypothetical protein
MKLLLGLLVCLSAASSARAVQYSVDINARMRGQQEYYQSETRFLFYPEIDIRKDGALTNAFVTLLSPFEHFVGYKNHPELNTARSSLLQSTDQIVSFGDGTWRVRIDDGAVHEWEVDVSLVLPFAVLPHFSSTTLVSGRPAGAFDWLLEGGSAAYPGPSSILRTAFAAFGGGGNQLANLPYDATSWSPIVDGALGQEFFASVATLNEAADVSALQILAIRPLTANAPELTFSTPSITYSAVRSAKFGPPVPEPAGVAMAIFSLSALLMHQRARKSGPAARKLNCADAAPLLAPG